jgi:hypothetical protein
MAEHFTRESAEALLPRVEPLLRKLQALRAEFDAIEKRAAALQTRLSGNGHLHRGEVEAVRAEAGQLSDEINSHLQEITALGVLVKDLDIGLIDFLALRDGREVYLCWRLGEEGRIAWWHEIDAGFAGRQPLDD